VLKKGTGTSPQTETLDEIEPPLGASPLFQQAVRASNSLLASNAGIREDSGVYCPDCGFRLRVDRPPEAQSAPKVPGRTAQGNALCITHFLQGCLEAGLLGNVLPDKG
jgi:hypothetical protein